MPGDFFKEKFTLFLFTENSLYKKKWSSVLCSVCKCTSLFEFMPDPMSCDQVRMFCLIWAFFRLFIFRYAEFYFIFYFFTWGILELKRKYLLKNRKMKSITLLGFMRCLKSFKEVLDFNENLFYSSSCKTNGIHNAADIWNDENIA